MNKYQCQVCGAVSYSAASQENLKDNSCLECDGRVEMVEGDKMNADEIVREQWRPICGYEGLYEISNFGNVRSITRIVGSGRLIQGQPIRQFKRAGYWSGEDYQKESPMGKGFPCYIGPCARGVYTEPTSVGLL